MVNSTGEAPEPSVSVTSTPRSVAAATSTCPEFRPVSARSSSAPGPATEQRRRKPRPLPDRHENLEVGQPAGQGVGVRQRIAEDLHVGTARNIAAIRDRQRRVLIVVKDRNARHARLQDREVRISHGQTTVGCSGMTLPEGIPAHRNPLVRRGIERRSGNLATERRLHAHRGHVTSVPWPSSGAENLSIACRKVSGRGNQGPPVSDVRANRPHNALFYLRLTCPPGNAPAFTSLIGPDDTPCLGSVSLVRLGPTHRQCNVRAACPGNSPILTGEVPFRYPASPTKRFTRCFSSSSAHRS